MGGGCGWGGCGGGGGGGVLRGVKKTFLFLGEKLIFYDIFFFFFFGGEFFFFLGFFGGFFLPVFFFFRLSVSVFGPSLGLESASSKALSTMRAVKNVQSKNARRPKKRGPKRALRANLALRPAAPSDKAPPHRTDSDHAECGGVNHRRVADSDVS